MFTHVLVGSRDLDRARSFYDNALGALGIPPATDMMGKLFYNGPEGAYAVGTPIEGEASHANGGTIGFKAPNQEAVDKFHAEGLANGGSCEGAPGPRAMPGSYGAYLRDPDGNKICAYTFG